MHMSNGGFEDINRVFLARDRAVTEKNIELFRSTQLLDEIPNAASDGYLALDKLQSDVLAVDWPQEISAVAFVRETYQDRGTVQRSTYLIYRLVLTQAGWRVYRVDC